MQIKFEGSTIRGIVWIAAALIVWMHSHDTQSFYTAIAMALGGASGVLTPDNLKE